MQCIRNIENINVFQEFFELKKKKVLLKDIKSLRS